MRTRDYDHLVGAIALVHVRERYLARITEEDFDGGFHVLSGFTAKQLAGFAAELQEDGDFASRVRIRFPAAFLAGLDVPEDFLTSKSAVDVRNRDYNGKLVITAELEKDAGASLAECDRTDVEQIRTEGLAETWVDRLSAYVGVSLIEDARRQLVAATKGLFETARSTAKTTCEFLCRTLSIYESVGQVTRAAGMSLPALGMPLWRNFSIPTAKLGQPSAWRDAFSKHAARACYLYKRDTKHILLDVDELRERLAELRMSSDTPLPEDLLEAFHTYIETKEHRCGATERLLFEFDWDYVQNCFDRARSTASSGFVQQTRQALQGDNVYPTDEEEALLGQMAKRLPKVGNVPDEIVEFFNQHVSSISENPRLLSQWESIVHGTKVICTNLLEGIAICIERSWNVRTPGRELRLRLVGQRQLKPNQLRQVNPVACAYFERNYADLPSLTGNKILFQNTILIQYSREDYQEWFRNNGVQKRTAKKANTLEFQAFFDEAIPGSDTWIEVDRRLLEWRFETGAILAEETSDLQRLAKILESSPKTALIETCAHYEAVGRKGSPPAVMLDDTQGFSDSFGAGGRGSFVPAISKAARHSLVDRWHDEVAKTAADHALPQNILAELGVRFEAFCSAYDTLMPFFARNALVQEGVCEMVGAYRELLLALCELPHEAVRRKLTRIVLSIGNTQIEKSGHRPPLAVVCPWHPLRMEASAARARQFRDHLRSLFAANPSSFSDGSGKLFFGELSALLTQPLYPEVTLTWDSSEARVRTLSQTLGGYTLHEPPAAETGQGPAAPDDSKAAAKQIGNLVEEYLRLQPHERDNLSVGLYDCDSANLLSAVVAQINDFNDKRKDDEVTCQVYLMHRNEDRLREIYRELIANGAGSEEGSPTEATGDFLAKVRVNIVAANSIKKTGRGEPIDIVYCRDIVSRRAKLSWIRRPRIVVGPDELQPHKWSRRLPVEKGVRQASLQLCCPAQTEAGWSHLYALSTLLTHDAKDAWHSAKCPLPMKIIDFDLKDIQGVFGDTHNLATWVVNQDEILDRRLVEAQNVKVIRYIQSSTQGRNLVISSTAKETLLLNTLKEKLRDILPVDYPADQISPLAELFVKEANQISGGLVLKAARRAKNTNELLGMVLSRFIVRTEIGLQQPAAWCFLDDYATWLGKREEAQIADLLVLSPTVDELGERVLDIVVTEAKFIRAEGLSEQSKRSEQQLRDTLRQIEEALASETASLDQDVWLSRISDMLLTRLELPTSQPDQDLDGWRTAIRNRQCKVRIRGYSHVFVHAPADFPGVDSRTIARTKNGAQEVFSPGRVRELILAFATGDISRLNQIRDPSLLDMLDWNPCDIPAPPSLVMQNAAGAPVPLDGSGHPDAAAFAATPELKGSANSDGAPPTEPRHDLEPSSMTDSQPAAESAATFSAIATPEIRQLIPVAADQDSSILMAYLERRAKDFSSSKEEGLVWLKETGVKLKAAFLARQLPFKAVEGFGPILTPNAGIFRLQGSPNLTVPLIESKAQEIFTSETIHILAVSPEPGRLRLTVARPNRELLHTEAVLLDFLLKYPHAAEREELLVGIREEDGQPLFFNPYDQPHTLIAGSTGSGKSVLMQNIILSIAATRSPEESRIFLIDPKYGNDFMQLQGLPHIVAGSNGIIDSRDDALGFLNEAVSEMERRFQLFKAAGGGLDIRSYRRVTGDYLPTWWIIHDEFADWMQVDEYREAIPQLVNRLSVKARAAGIFLIFAAQRPDNHVFPIQMRDQLGNRLVLKVQSQGTSEIALGEKGAERLLGRGHMLVRLAGDANPIFAQVPFIDPLESIPPLVQQIRIMHAKRLR